MQQVWKQVSLDEAHLLSSIGEVVPNPRFGRVPDEPRRIFRAKYLVHYRPNPNLPELQQFALITQA